MVGSLSSSLPNFLSRDASMGEYESASKEASAFITIRRVLAYSTRELKLGSGGVNACLELESTTKDNVKTLSPGDVVLLVFANKQGLPNAMNAAEITDKLGLHSFCQRH